MSYHPTCAITQMFNTSTEPASLDPRQYCPYQVCALAGTEAWLLSAYYGVAALDAIRFATAHGPRSLGALGMAPRTGVLRAGFDADVIALTRNPLDDISVLAFPGNITHVWRGGRLFKAPAREVAHVNADEPNEALRLHGGRMLAVRW